MGRAPMPEMAEVAYTVELERCIRCGACAIVAPSTFEVTGRVRLVRQPATAGEAAACAVAALICPTQAIHAAAVPS